MAKIRVCFDRGTLRVDGDVLALSELVRFDERTGFHRAAAHHYSELLRRARARGIEVEDGLSSVWRGRHVASAAPELRSYQEQALAAFDAFGRRGIIALPTGSGKTRVACAALAQSGESCLVLVPTRVLLEQWLGVLRAQFGGPIGAVGDGMKSICRITVMTFESAYRCLDRFGDAFSMLVVDEAHHFAGGLRAEALEMCPAPVRLGLTATPPPPGSAGAERLFGLIGPVVFQLEIADPAGGALAELDLIRLPVRLTVQERAAYERDIEAFTRLRRELRRVSPDLDWLACVQHIARTPGGSRVLAGMQRASALAAFPAGKRSSVRALLARHRGDRTLLFTSVADHAYALAEEALLPVITAACGQFAAPGCSMKAWTSRRPKWPSSWLARSGRASTCSVWDESCDPPKTSAPSRTSWSPWTPWMRCACAHAGGCLLPAPLLLVASSEPRGGQAVPRYLGSHDEVWVRAALDLFDAYVGRTAGERELELPGRVRSLAREHGAPARAADGVAHVLLRRFKTQVDAQLEPQRVRAVVFEEAGRDDVFDRDSALRRAGERLGASPQEVARTLFADRPARRRVVAPDEPLPAAGVVELYNLALVQGLLQRSEQVRVDVREHVRAVVRFAKLSGLLCTYASVAGGTRLELSGPLAILRHTTKYGFALASFLPAVVATPGFRLEARCVLGGEPVTVHIGAADRIARTHQLPKDTDSAVERALARDVRRLVGEWTLARESDTVAVEGSAVFPDFTLRHVLGFAVLVEVVGFYTPEYLRSKLVALRAAASRPLIVCIDEALAWADGEVPGAVLRFRKRVDAAALLALAEELRTGARSEATELARG